MKLSQRQQIFTHQISKLIIWGFENGYNVRFGEVERPLAMQLLYYFGFKIIQENDSIKLIKCKRRSKTLKSNHLNKTSADLFLFINGKYISNPDRYRPLGEKWESMGGKWGGRFGVSPINYSTKVGWDSNHFEM